ncbi:MAG: TetR/AcrR family transcriptional regulator, partial [Acidimicrobiales bacterium]
RLPAARRRRQLLSVALECFAAAGYHATSMDDIAERAGVTKPVLYQHFGSKSELYRELIETVGADLLGTVTARATADAEPYLRVLDGFRAYFRFVAEQPAAWGLLFASGARQEEEFAGAVRSVESRIAATIADLIEVGIEPEHRELLAFGIVGLAETTSRLWVERRRRPGPAGGTAAEGEGDVMARRLADLVWAGLRALPPAGARPGAGRARAPTGRRAAPPARGASA